MNKKLLTVLVAILLVVTMSVCLFACSDAESTSTKKASFSVKDSDTSKIVTKSIQINEKSSFDIASSVVMSESEVQSKVSVKDQNGNAVVMKATQTGDKLFRVAALGNDSFVAGKWY
jgi:uncharacterized lipoprotein YehR (DUF1307 family)